MEEEHYSIDCIDTSGHEWRYLVESGIEDTRLIKISTQEKDLLVLRPQPLEEKKRLPTVTGNYIEIANTFRSLLEELSSFDIEIPEYQIFISDTHTQEGSRGEGICISSKYIKGKCLPLDCNGGYWENNLPLFYEKMDNWLTDITEYSVAKYLSADNNTLFLTDVYRPIQFVYSFENRNIYLVDLDPLFEKLILNNKINSRFLVGLTTINRNRNIYMNKFQREEPKKKGFGSRSQEIIYKLLQRKDFLNNVSQNPQDQRILSNLQNSIMT